MIQILISRFSFYEKRGGDTMSQSQFLLFIETMPISPNVVQLHTKDKYGNPVVVYVRRDQMNQWQWQFETPAGKSLWHSGDLDEIRNYWRTFSLQ